MLAKAADMAIKNMKSASNPSQPTNFAPPKTINGSQFDRPALDEGFAAQEEFFKKIASFSDKEKEKFGYSLKELVKTCNYDGKPCDLDR